MKKLMTTLTAAIALTALTSGLALAAANKSDVNEMVKANIGNESLIFTDVADSTVVLTGFFGDMHDKTELLSALRTTDGVERIVDYTIVKIQ